jgi:23S rRNA pseudouridine1911/1915/1917 synthase
MTVTSATADDIVPLRAAVPASAAGSRLDAFIAEAMPALSRTRAKALILAGAVEIDGMPVTEPRRSLSAGEEIAVRVPPPRPATPTPEAIALDIVYEDAELIVIDKPAGLVVHPAAGNETGTLVNALIAHCGASLSGIGGVMRPGIVHRLDKDTSGLLVVAKTDHAHRALSEQFADHGREGALERGYLALVWGAPPRSHGTINAPIGRHTTSRTKMAVVPATKGGRAAVTHYQVLATFGRGPEPIASLLECKLETGRTHQVRVHLASLGTPLVGDPVYGTGFKSKLRKLPEPVQQKLASFDRQALHAAALTFVHPMIATLLEFNSPLPEDFAMIVEALKEL